MTCPEEGRIIESLRQATVVQAGWTPLDTPRLIYALAEHRRRCATCQGVSLEAQLFGCQVAVSAETVRGDYASR